MAGVGQAGSASGDVAARPSVSFNYDQLGIRSFMSDGAGTVSYNINALGQIQSETRQFTMSGAPTNPFTVNYDYGLAGQLKSITDPFGDQINYAYDKAGRLSSATGATPFAGVTNYLSGVQYRAWGAVKNNRTFDIRMRLTSAYHSAGPINYQYNKANDLTYAEMTTGSPYHQTYGYDHVGRLSSVSTPEITVPNQYVCTVCSPPNGLPPNYKVRPFTTNVTYDEFDNATSSGGNYWHDITWNLNATPQSFTTTYVNGRAKKDGVAGKVYNNRDEVWSYNAMGQVTNDTRTVQTFDSAGQTTRTEGTANAQIYVNYAYDGDGRQVKFDQKRDDGSTELRYRIYSTVLGGLLSDVKAAGQKIETRVYTFVYPESTVRQVKAYSVPNYGSYPDTVVFEGSDPHGTRAQVWDRDTNTSKTLALAAPGAYVEDINWQGMKDRYVSGIGIQIAYGQVAASRALDAHNMTIDPRNPGTGCSLDGVKTQCSQVFKYLRQGGLERFDVVSPLRVFNGTGFTIGRTTDPDEDNLNKGLLIYIGTGQQAKTYDDCIHLAPWSQKNPVEQQLSKEKVNMIIAASALANVDPTLLAATISFESRFNLNTPSNLNDGEYGNADVGPMQINYNTFRNSKEVNGLGDVFGHTPNPGGEFPDEFPLAPYATGNFNGDPFSNMIAGGRILSSYGGTRGSSVDARSNASGYFRTGKGAFFKKKIGKSRFKQRKEAFDAVAPAWDNLFGCLGVKTVSQAAKDNESAKKKKR